MNTPARSKARSAARLAAVQALYQRHMEDTHLARLLDEFHQHRLGREIEGDHYADAEVDFFDDVVSGAIARQEEIDALLGEKLAEGWSVARLDKTMLQILRPAAFATASSTPLTNFASRSSKKALATSTHSLIAAATGTSGRAMSS